MAILDLNMLKGAVVISTFTSGGEVDVGTGFVIGIDETVVEEGYWQHKGRVVTCAHVLEDALDASMTGEVGVRFNSTEKGRSRAVRYPGHWWVRHPKREHDKENAGWDVAATGVDSRLMEREKLDWRWIPERMGMRKEEMQEREVWEGNEILTMGFPAGQSIKGVKRDWPVVRWGVLAQVQPWFEGRSEDFLIDMEAFPGQSGSPIILRPTTEALGGGRDAVREIRILGMLCQRTLAPVEIRGLKGQMEILEGSGFGRAVGWESIMETLRMLEKKLKEEGGILKR